MDNDRNIDVNSDAMSTEEEDILDVEEFFRSPEGAIRFFEDQENSMKEVVTSLSTIERQTCSYHIWCFVQSKQLSKKIQAVENFQQDPSGTDPNGFIGKNTAKLLIYMLPKWTFKKTVIDEFMQISKLQKNGIRNQKNVCESMIYHLQKRNQLSGYSETDLKAWMSKLRMGRVVVEEEECNRKVLKERALNALTKLDTITRNESIECQRLLQSARSNKTGDISPQIVKAIYEIAEITSDSSSIYLHSLEQNRANSWNTLQRCKAAFDTIAQSQDMLEKVSYQTEYAYDVKEQTRKIPLQNHLIRMEALWASLRLSSEILDTAIKVMFIAESEQHTFDTFCEQIKLIELFSPRLINIMNSKIPALKSVWQRGYNAPGSVVTPY